MNTSHFKNTITSIPTFLDGSFELYEIKVSDSLYPIEFIEPVTINDILVVIPYEELSITDRLRYEFEKRDSKITMKIRIPSTKEIDSFNVVKIGNEFHKVFNAFHFKNADGFSMTDLTLEKYIVNEEEDDKSRTD